MFTRRFALALFLLALPALAAAPRPVAVGAQASGAEWRTLAGGDEILSLALGPDGQLHAGTEGGGLVVWNARRTAFEQYLFPMQAGLPSNDVRAVALAPDGTAWLATPAGVSHAVGNPWRLFDVDDGLPSVDVTALAVDPQGTVWAGTHADGVASLDPRRGVWTAYPAVEFVRGDQDLKDGPGNAKVSAIAAGEDGRVWVAHGRSSVAGQPALSVYDPRAAGWRFISAVEPGADPGSGAATEQILTVAVDGSGVLWLGTWGRGVLWYDEAADTWSRYTVADGTCGNNVWAVALDGPDVWIACSEGGVARWDGAAWRDWTLVDPADGAELEANVVRALAAADGTAYLGLNGPGDGGAGIAAIEGLYVVEPLTTAPDTPWSNDITALAFEPDTGVAWVGTRGSGLMRYDGTAWTRYTEADTGGALPGDTIVDLQLRDEELWVATTKTTYGTGSYLDGGVAAIDTATERWLHLLRRENSNLPDDDVSSLALTADGRLWVGMGIALGAPGHTSAVQDGNGLVVVDPDAGAVETWYQYLGGAIELAGPTVLDLAARGRDVWVATSYATVDDRKRGGGVSVWADGQWESWAGGMEGLVTYHGSGNPTDVDPFITGDVRSVMVDRRGRAWAGAWDLDAGSLSSLWPYVDAVVNRREGERWLSDSFAGDGWVSALAEDYAGDVWAGTTRGHDVQEADLLTGRRADTARGGIRVYDGGSWSVLAPANSGLAGNAITALAVDPTTGYMWVGTENNGLSVHQVGEPVPTPTPCLDCPTNTPRPSVTATVPPIGTVPPGGTGVAPTAGPGGLPTMTPLPGPQPPPEVPEASTLVLLALGLAALAGYVHWRRRQVPAV